MNLYIRAWSARFPLIYDLVFFFHYVLFTRYIILKYIQGEAPKKDFKVSMILDVISII